MRIVHGIVLSTSSLVIALAPGRARADDGKAAAPDPSSVQGTIKLLVGCYAGDPEPCLQANLGEIRVGAAKMRAKCGAVPAMSIDAAFVDAVTKARLSVVGTLDQVLDGLTWVCKDASSKARFAAVKTVRFTYSPDKAVKSHGVSTIALAKQGDTVVVTYFASAANLRQTAQEWVKTGL